MAQQIGRRIIVIGSSNAGKSTLAERLAGQFGVPFIELDALYWEPNWTHPQPEAFRERVRAAIEPEAWVMAGNYSAQRDLSWPRADTIVWLDLPLRTVLWRCIARSWQRWRSRELLWGTNRERLWDHLLFWDTDRSLPSFIVRHHRSRRRRYEQDLQHPGWSHITFIRLQSVEEIECWFAEVTSSSGSQQLAAAEVMSADDAVRANP